MLDCIAERLKSISHLEETGDIKDTQKMMDYLYLLQTKDIETFYHSTRVAEYAFNIAVEMGLNNYICDVIYLSGLFHDIGKLLIPKLILLNTDTLSDTEFEIIKKHSFDGYCIAKNFLSEYVCTPILEHHERLNGMGYPFNKTSLCIESRIVAVADTFDAMTSYRVYQDSMSKEDALKTLNVLSVDKKYYDIDVVNALSSALQKSSSEVS